MDTIVQQLYNSFAEKFSLDTYIIELFLNLTLQYAIFKWASFTWIFGGIFYAQEPKKANKIERQDFLKFKKKYGCTTYFLN